MSGEQNTIKQSSSSDKSQKTLTPEESLKLEQDRKASINSKRDKTLTDSISGNNNIPKNTYSELKERKEELQNKFDELHVSVQDQLSDYSQSLSERAKAGWAKLKQSKLYNDTMKMVKNFIFIKNGGDANDVGISQSGMTDERFKSYVSSQEHTYNEQSKVDAMSYEQSQLDFNLKNDNVYHADTILTDSINQERSLVADMRFTDEQMRFESLG